MINVRKSVFETNSSSSHSIVITKERAIEDRNSYFRIPVYHSKQNDYRYCPHRDDLDFGRSPFEVLMTFERKVCYAIASFGESRFDEIEDIVIKYGKAWGDREISGIQLPTSLYYDDDEDEEETYYGYVDHQSMSLLGNVLFNEDISIEEFLVNPKYIVIIDGDEYLIWYGMKELGLINKNAIDKEYGDI